VYSEVFDLKPTSKLAQSCLKNSAHLLQIWFVRMVSGSGCRAATTPPRLRGAEAALARGNSSTDGLVMRVARPVALAAQARAAAEQLARIARFAGSPCAAELGAIRRRYVFSAVRRKL